MFLSISHNVPTEYFCGGTKLYDHEGDLVATVIKQNLFLLEKAAFDKLPDDTVFKVITTKLHTVEHDQLLKFVCKKGQANDWAIYWGLPTEHDIDISRHGNKVQSIENVLCLCPCSIEVLNVYRR